MSTSSNDTPFELAPEIYDQLINWPRRLEREGPFFRRLFESHGVRSVLDTACGTGHHANLFASWGLDVLGMDALPQMITFCRRTHGESTTLRWAEARMEDLPVSDRRFDAVVCLGNSLALLPDRGMVDQVIAGMAQQLNPGGLVVVHLLNLRRLPDGPIVWQRARHVAVGSQSICIVKAVHRAGDRGFVDFAEVRPDEFDNVSRCRSTPLLGLTPDDLQSAFKSAGLQEVSFHGNHDRQPYTPDTSQDLIAVAT